MELPPAILHKLEQTLAQWQQWKGPESPPGAPHVIGPLGGGSSNYSVLVAAAEQKFVVRLDRASPAANGLSRQAEWHAVHAGHAAGIAPRPYYFNPDLGCLVCEYLEPDTDSAPSVDALAALLRSLHGLPRLRFRMDPVERMRRYERQLPDGRRSLLELGSAVRTATAAEQVAICLCHHDLNPHNLIQSGGRLLAVDWEYCAMGNPWFDLAVLIEECALAEEDRDALLTGYLGRSPGPEDWDALHRQGLVARYLTLLWLASGQGVNVDEDALSEHCRTLEASLALSP